MNFLFKTIHGLVGALRNSGDAGSKVIKHQSRVHGSYSQELPERSNYSHERFHFDKYPSPSRSSDSPPHNYHELWSYQRRLPPTSNHGDEWPRHQYGRRQSREDESPRLAFPVSRPYSQPPPLGYPEQSNLIRIRSPSSHYTSGKRQKLEGRYSRITDDYISLPQVTEALKNAGLESSNLIVGIDFTKSNEWTGKHSFQGRCLHSIGTATRNPYEQAISIIGQTLHDFDEDNNIPCFGFGDASTHDQDVFSFYPGGKPCYGFEEALQRYQEIVPCLRLSGPTSFAPIIEMAMTIVEESGGQYHVLLIIADGQVTRSVDTSLRQLSSQEQKTVDAIIKASKFPLSIILVGVGDGPWDKMKEFDDHVPARSFDNFQFVNFTEIMAKDMPTSKKETEFALAALMEIPQQYKATIELQILGRQQATSPKRTPLPPPSENLGAASSNPSPSQSTSSRTSLLPSAVNEITEAAAAPALDVSSNAQVCPVCLNRPNDMVFGCGHQTCRDCEQRLTSCPICRRPIETRIRTY